MKIFTALVLFLLSISLKAADRPNILWLTSEDNSPYLGCYGDGLAVTPNIDALATQGVRYDLAFSNAPVCSVARTTLLLGMYPTALGLQNHRSRYPVPKGLKGYPELFREAGYYCTNNSKTDYNVDFGDKRTLWDESSGKAHYKNRKEGQPFFAVFNFTESHEGQTFPEVVERNRKSGKLPKTSRLSLGQVKLPPYHPDLPEIRREWADFYDCMTTMDKRIGKALKELEESGLADDTIVFYYGDHGGSLARGKRSMLDSGTRVPLIIRFGKNWKHLAPSGPGTATDRMVSFVDFAPTALSLAGIKVPEFMHGEAFLGAQAKAPRDHVFLYRGRMDERYDTIRAIRTKDRLYVKNYMPHLPNGQHYSYAYNSRITPAWEECYEDGGCDEVQSIYWQPKSPEEFYLTKDDPHQVRNLIGEAGEQEAIGKLRAVLEGEMRNYHDAGLIPEAMYPVVAGGKSVGWFVAKGDYDFDGLKKLADAASLRQVAALGGLREAMRSEDPLRRYWGAFGCVVLGEDSVPAKGEMTGLLKDENKMVRVTAAVALGKMGEQDAAIALLQKEIMQGTEYEVLAAVHGLEQFPDGWEEVKGRLEELKKAGRNNDTARVATFMLSKMN